MSDTLSHPHPAQTSPELSVVLASSNAEGSIRDCIRTIRNQCDNGHVEILVVDNSTDSSGEILRDEFPDIRVERADPDLLIPELWGIGIDRTDGKYIALTTTHFVPSNNWIAEIFSAHAGPDAGIGGAIENSADADLVSWAVYFCRYSPYMLPFPAAEVEDFAADNASYKRADLLAVSDSMGDGFWETFVHKQMRAAGQTLVRSPKIVVHHTSSFSFLEFVKQRFLHGEKFGISRAAGQSGGRTIAMILTSPLIPFLYMFRIFRRVIGKRRNLSRLVLSLPVLSIFLTSWAAGECVGYIRSLAR